MINRFDRRKCASGTNVFREMAARKDSSTGYSLRSPTQGLRGDNFFSSSGQPPMSPFVHSSDVRQDCLISSIPTTFGRTLRLKVPCAGQAGYPTVQNGSRNLSLSLSGRRARFSVSKAAGAVTLKLPPSGSSPSYLRHFSYACNEQRLGERSRFRTEAFDGRMKAREIFLLVPTPLKQSALFGRDTPRLQSMLQRRKRESLSGWTRLHSGIASSRNVTKSRCLRISALSARTTPILNARGTNGNRQYLCQLYAFKTDR